MGIDYDQKCMVGFYVLVPDIKQVISEAIYENQNRYNTKTGKLIRTEKVLVKEADIKYVFMGKKEEDWTVLMEDLADELGLDCFVEDYDYSTGGFCIGTFIGDKNSMGHVDFLTGEVDIAHIVSLQEKIQSKCGQKVSLHFLSQVG